MKIPKDVIEQDYEFWKKNYVEQVQAWIDYFMDYEIVEVKRYKESAPAYRTLMKENLIKTIKLFKERYQEKDILNFSTFNMGFHMVYINSSVSHIGLTYEDMVTISTHGNSKDGQITDYLLNKIDMLDWYRETQEYKSWLKRREWIKNNPKFTKQPEDKEVLLGRIVKITQAKLKTSRYSQDKVLSRLKNHS